MPRVTTALAAALALFLPIGRPLLVGLTPAVGISTGLLSTQIAYAQSAGAFFDSGVAKSDRGDLQGAISDYTKAIEYDPNYALFYNNRGAARER
ncbi:tetratricopeptide repeat protein [Synechococcus sp. KORDI-100]|uniref:tetratricopeptide repeat protein n=1 Tax=Synechococcus sp. KORDI-100 TaxID=1280380 RepID=UPI0008FFC1D7|nr:tetratricopeptide repeat protein [Synechococcus sp. KORDI-100]